MVAPIGNYNTNIPTGINIQIFNAPCPPCEHEKTVDYTTVPVYPANYYTKELSKVNEKTEVTKVIKEEKTENKETKEVKEGKKIVKITDEYIKTLESYLSSKDIEKRILASKDILERVQEDDSRKDNLALTALTNKMLKDPYQPIRFLALGILEDRKITGNAETVDILRKIETGRYSANGNTDQDAIKASDVLLKMTRKVQE